MTDETKKARDSVERLAMTLEPPAPPAGFPGTIGGRTRTWRKLLTPVAAVVIVGLGVGLLVLRPLDPVPDDPGKPQVILEHLRILGAPAEFRMIEPPGADALIIIVSEPGREGSGLRRDGSFSSNEQDGSR